MHSLLRYLSFTAIFTTNKVIFSERTNKMAHFYNVSNGGVFLGKVYLSSNDLRYGISFLKGHENADYSGSTWA